MPDLVCVAFDDPDAADHVLTELNQLQKEFLVQLADACVVVRDANGEVHLKQAMPLVAMGAASGGSWGALWGTLVGLLFLQPLAGLAIGAAVGAGSGALAGKFSDYGIPDNFIKEAGEKLTPNSSALFLLIQKVVADKVLPHFEQYKGKAHVLKTSLSDEQETALKDFLGQQAPATA